MNREERLKRYEILENLRSEKGVRYSAIAKELGLPPVIFSDWKSGKSMPKGDKMEKIADYFGVPSRTFY